MNTSTNYTVVVGSNGLSGTENHFNKGFQETSYKITLLGVDISRLSQTVQFILVSAGVFVFFVLYGYLLVSDFDLNLTARIFSLILIYLN